MILNMSGKLPYTIQVQKKLRKEAQMRAAGRRTSRVIRDARLEARVPRETKALCARAAAIEGSSLTDFLVNSAIVAARRIVRENELADLTHRDRMAFVEALLHPSAPNVRLQDAAARHARMFGR
jgi:uncharacterized protein (DUF1778 family)